MGDCSAVVEAHHRRTATAVVGIHAELDDAGCGCRGIIDAERSLTTRAPHNIQECRGLRVRGRARSAKSNRWVGRCLELDRGRAHGDFRYGGSDNNCSDRMLRAGCECQEDKNINQVILIYENNLPHGGQCSWLGRKKADELGD